jgi:hypothetical protein
MPLARRDPPGSLSAMTSHEPQAKAAFRRVLIRVLAVQAVALLLLWLLQARYPAGG